MNGETKTATDNDGDTSTNLKVMTTLSNGAGSSPLKAETNHNTTMSPSRVPMGDDLSPGTRSPDFGAEKDYGQSEVELVQLEINKTIHNLDHKLNVVLAKQEYEYLKSYNIYVKRKEKELRDLIEKLNEKNSNNTLKDEKINNLEKTIQSIRDDQIRMEKEKDERVKEIKKWQSRANNFEQERDFLQQQVLESKRQNKLLKIAITRLKDQVDSQGNLKHEEMNIPNADEPYA
jgi:hypothetical protein